MSSHQHGPGTPGKSIEPGGLVGLWAADDFEGLLADPRNAGRLGRALAAAGAPAGADRHNGEDAAVRAFRTAFDVIPSAKPPGRARMTGRAAAAILVGGLVLSGGAAAAALTGAQQTAQNVLAKVGLSVPGATRHSDGHNPKPGAASPTPVPKERPHMATGGNPRPGSGSAISALAHSTAATGVDKGATVSGAASNGKSQAGQHGKATTRSTAAAKTPRPNPTRGRHHGTHPHTPPGSADTPTNGDSSTPKAAHSRR